MTFNDQSIKARHHNANAVAVNYPNVQVPSYNLFKSNFKVVDSDSNVFVQLIQGGS